MKCMVGPFSFSLDLIDRLVGDIATEGSRDRYFLSEELKESASALGADAEQRQREMQDAYSRLLDASVWLINPRPPSYVAKWVCQGANNVVFKGRP